MFGGMIVQNSGKKKLLIHLNCCDIISGGFTVIDAVTTKRYKKHKFTTKKDIMQLTTHHNDHGRTVNTFRESQTIINSTETKTQNNHKEMEIRPRYIIITKTLKTTTNR